MRFCFPSTSLATGTAALLTALLAAGPLVAQTTPQAFYPLLTDLFDATNSYGPVSLIGTPPPAMPSGNGVCVNGIRFYNAGGQNVRTPIISSLNMADFQIDVEFNMAALPAGQRPVLTGGNSHRWIGIALQTNGTVGVKYNNNNYAWSSTVLVPGTWYAASLKYENGIVALSIDGALAIQTTVGPLNHVGDKNVMTVDYTNGHTFHGCIRNLRISNDADLGFNRASTGCGGLTLTEAGSPTRGGTVSFTVGGPFAASGIMFGFAAANQPLCPPSPCALGLTSVGSIPGPSVSLTIPNTVPIGATVLFQGIALSANGCNFGGGVTASVTDTVQAVIQ